MRHFIYIYAPGSYFTVALAEVSELELQKIKDSTAINSDGYFWESTEKEGLTFWALQKISVKEVPSEQESEVA